ncbi:MAG TPA: TonB-dependent receptor [Acidobacteriaceae bacterium]|nr:TonB-dependent receptor [Acidobacteriaceae bacterium]
MYQSASKRWAPVWLTIFLLSFGVSAGIAQVDTGTILGTVKDQTGAVVPDARVTVTNQGTSEQFTTTTRGDGTYIVTPLKIGTYRISVEHAGFQRAENAAFGLNIQQQAVVDFVLQPGATSQTVQVTAEAALLQTQSATVGQVIGSQTVENMPLNGRDWTMLATLTPGVTQPQQGARAGNQFAANGTRPAQNDYLLDGIDNNSNDVDFLSGEADVVKPPVDAIQEFNIQTNNFSAEFGRAGGAIVNATIKSGTNGFHGTVWEFFRNDALDANAYFSDPATQRKPELRQNQFGAVAGGRIIRDKTFWFADWEGTQIHAGVLQSGIWVPTTPEASSGFTNFADLLNATGNFTRTDALGRSFSNGQIFDPATTRPVTAGQVDPFTGITAATSGYVREAFPNNQLPAARLDANAIKILHLFPAQNLPGVENNYQVTTLNTTSQNTFDVRIDQHFNEHNQMFGRYSYINSTQQVPPPFTGVADGGAYGDGTQKWDVYGVAVSYTHVFNPTLINEVRFGYGQEHTTRTPSTANTLGIPAQYGIGGVPQFAGNGGLPYMSFNQIHNLGGSEWLPGDRYSDTTQLTENLTKVYKSHTFKGGIEFQYLYFPWLAPPESKGAFDFDGRYTSIPNQTDKMVGTAQFLLTPIAATVPSGVNYSGGSDQVQASNYGYLHSNRNYWGVYAQDDWKVTPRLTLNLGLRWEYFGQVGDTNGAQANFIPGIPGSTAQFIMTSKNKSIALSPSFTENLAKDGIQLVYTNQYGTGLGISQRTNFGPRFGASYQITPKLVGRVGYGIFYGAFENRGGDPSLGYNYPFEYVLSFQDSSNGGVGSVTPTIFPDGSYGTLENGLSGISLTPISVSGNGLQFRGVQFHYQTPYTQGFNLTLQYALTPQDSIQAGYVGSVGRHMEAFAGTNNPSQILPPGTPITPYLAYPDFANNSSYDITAGSSSYNSLQTKYERRFSHGFYMLAGFTWARTLSDSGDLLSNGGVGGYRAPQITGISYDRGLASFNINRSFVASSTYELPIGNGKVFLGDLHGPGQLLLGGWIVNGILTLNSGPPQYIPCQITTTATTGTCYADVIPGVSKYRSGGPAHYYNPAAFTEPPVATTIGNSNLAPLGGSNTQVNGPGYRDLDFSIFKEFRVTETTRLQFRAESFNFTNTPSFNLPTNTNFTDTVNFGQSTTTRGTGNNIGNQRQIQFALKYYW